MKRYLGKIEELTAERYEELGWAPAVAKQMVKEGATEPHVYVVEDGEEELLEPDDESKRQSPDGFSWGYAGSGPTALARTMLLDFTGAAPEPGVLIAFRDEKLRPLDMDAGFVIEGEEIETWLRGFDPRPPGDHDPIPRPAADDPGTNAA